MISVFTKQIFKLVGGKESLQGTRMKISQVSSNESNQLVVIHRFH